ncbi:MAG TPA: hypothetical protein DCZ94_05775 [Lentisphaeria bacterium]|nr:hypothetical protein [Lentisphaeria bacterium]
MKEKHQIEKEKQLSLNQDTIRSKIFICPAKEDAQKVFLAGTFNNWALMPMTRLKSCFHAILRLKPGEYQYKFVVDGKWLEDPEAKSVQNVFGTANSIVSVD